MCEQRKIETNVHKEEYAGRIKSDAADRTKLRKKLDACIDPLSTANHPKELVNIASGRINSDSTVNVAVAVDIGASQLNSFINKLPSGFYESLVIDTKV